MPVSSAIATSTGFGILRGVKAPSTSPVVQKAVQYYLDTFDDEKKRWDIIPAEAEESPRAFDPQPLAFGCTCSKQRVIDSLAGYSAEDIADLVTDNGNITADCQFCGKHYEFSADLVGQA